MLQEQGENHTFVIKLSSGCRFIAFIRDKAFRENVNITLRLFKKNGMFFLVV